MIKNAFSYDNIVIDSKTCSVLSAVFNTFLDDQSIEQILENYWDVAKDLEVMSKEHAHYNKMIAFLLSFEPGYLRVDHDEQHANSLIHPTNHIDINYSNGATFKIGLSAPWRCEKLIDLLDIKTTCCFITDNLS